MKTTVAKGFKSLYARYLDWFQERAGKEALPWDEEDLPRFQSFNEDVYENDRIVLNRVYYAVPLAPSHSRSGRLEVFTFSELNLMEKAGNDITNLRTVEYRVE